MRMRGTFSNTDRQTGRRGLGEMGTQELDGRARAPRRRRKYRLTFAHGTSRSPSRPVRAAGGLPGDVRLTSVHQQPRPCALPVCAQMGERGKVAAIGGLGGKGWLCSRCRYCRREGCSAALFGMRDAATMAMPEVTKRVCGTSGLESTETLCMSPGERSHFSAVFATSLIERICMCTNR